MMLLHTLCGPACDSGVARGESGSTRPGVQALRAHLHTFCSNLKTRFKQKFRTKNA